MITTDAWVLHAGPNGGGPAPGGAANLRRETFAFPDLGDDEVLVEPLYGSWEANLEHALSRSPVDICRQRGEPSVVLGNIGVVRVLRTGQAPEARALSEGDVCMVMPFGKCDRYGYAELAYAYDAPGTIGLLAKRTKVAARMLLPLPSDSAYTLPQWATYARYFSAWDNWRVAYACWRGQLPDVAAEDHLVFGWGGGVVLAELELARRAGFRVAMTAGGDERLSCLARKGITPVDRRTFPDLELSRRLDEGDPDLVERYRTSEKEFLRIIESLSDGHGAAIFIDNIGAPLLRPTLKALGRLGVLTTLGWKRGMVTETRRAVECIKRHLHVNTHVWRSGDSPEILEYQAATGWIPDPDMIQTYDFEDVPRLADDYAAGKVTSYFPVFTVNPE
ncbi:hypothetical protein [Nonomuraea sp. NPDC049784]|uniref:hypothetical protein n=1 Tax=Nonomuraea sp. NPDC049784 TaxID=3154361 RepID=UPI0033DCE518